MISNKTFYNFILHLLKKKFSAEELKSYNLGDVKKVLIVRQHNQFGDLLASISLFRAVKEKYPDSKITLIASRDNHFAVEKNSYINSLFIFNNRLIWNPFYLLKLYRSLRMKYDIAIVPATVAISKTSCIIAAFSDAIIKIGPGTLNTKKNDLSFLFHYPINLNWKKCPDAHVSDFILDVIRPFEISTRNYKSSICFDQIDIKNAEDFINGIKDQNQFVVGFHVGAGKPQNRWPLEKYIYLIDTLKKSYPLSVYFTGSDSDKTEINFIKKNLKHNAGYFLNKNIPQVAALISLSDLFITNDTGIMHVAGAVSTPQISIFGPTNPFNWAPLGDNKFYVRQSELVGDVTVEEVFNLCKNVLEEKKIE